MEEGSLNSIHLLAEASVPRQSGKKPFKPYLEEEEEEEEMYSSSEEEEEEEHISSRQPKRPQKMPKPSSSYKRKRSTKQNLDQQLLKAIGRVFMIERTSPSIRLNPTAYYNNAVADRDRLLRLRDDQELQIATRPGIRAIVRALLARNLSTDDVMDWLNRPIADMYDGQDELSQLVRNVANEKKKRK